MVCLCNGRFTAASLVACYAPEMIRKARICKMKVLADSNECMRLVALTVIEMLRDRGYDMDHENDTYERFSNLETPSDDYKFEGEALHRSNGRRVAYTTRSELPSAIYTKEDTIKGVEDTYLPFLSDLQKADASTKGVHSVLLILDKPLMSSTYHNNGYLGDTIEVFLKRDLLFNVTKHVLVPEHRLLTKLEKTVMLKMLQVAEEDLKGIHQNDPIVRYFGGRIGDIFYIQRFEPLNTGPVRSRPELRIVRYIAEKEETKPAALIRERAYYTRKGIIYEKYRNTRLPSIRNFRRVPELDDEF